MVPDTFDALAHPARRALVDELRGGAARAGDLGHGLDITREAVGKHLRVLTAAGVLTVEHRGRERWYAVAPAGLKPVDDWLQPYRAFWTQRLDALSTEVARGRRLSGAASDQPASTEAPTLGTEQPMDHEPAPAPAPPAGRRSPATARTPVHHTITKGA